MGPLSEGGDVRHSRSCWGITQQFYPRKAMEIGEGSQ